MKHKFIVIIEGAFGIKEAQALLKDTGIIQGSLPPEERLSFYMEVYPVQNKPTYIKKKEYV